MNYDKTQQ